MKSLKLYQKILAGVVLLLSIVLILLFRNLPTGKLWENYSLLYVKNETPDSIITEVLVNNNITDYVSVNNQFIPLILNPHSPEMSFLKSNYDSQKFSYLKNRNFYFYDKSNSYRLYYIPVKQKNNLNNATKQLNNNNIFFGVDSSANYPFLLPLILLAAFGVFIYFSKNKFFFAFTSFLPLLFLICNPFYVISISEIMILMVLFFTSNVWKRKNFIIYLLSNYAIPIMVLLSFFTAFSCNYKVGLLHCLCIAGTFSSILVYSVIEDFFWQMKSFQPVFIMPVRRISIFHNKKNIIMSFSLGIATIAILLFLITSLGNININSSKIMVPAEKKSGTKTSSISYTAENISLPSLEDYYNFVWNVKTSPYISLNYETEELLNKQLNIDYSTTVVFPKYKIIETSGDNVNKNMRSIIETFEGLDFNQEFKDSTLDEIDLIQFESIEKVLKSQNKDFKGTYVSTSSYSTSLFGIIAMLFSYFILLFFYISIMIRRGFRK